ncbi:orf1ab poly [Solea senegalensis]|uniref:Orf1ab poly n=1 Tax=Solea senegalensis TaxID=28829 RepID=A0AAV6QU48_SOLSE|nr:orf1ab poly [Solea senegalensis]
MGKSQESISKHSPPPIPRGISVAQQLRNYCQRTCQVERGTQKTEVKALSQENNTLRKTIQDLNDELFMQGRLAHKIEKKRRDIQELALHNISLHQQVQDLSTKVKEGRKLDVLYTSAKDEKQARFVLNYNLKCKLKDLKVDSKVMESRVQKYHQLKAEIDDIQKENETIKSVYEKLLERLKHDKARALDCEKLLLDKKSANQENITLHNKIRDFHKELQSFEVVEDKDEVITPDVDKDVAVAQDVDEDDAVARVVDEVMTRAVDVEEVVTWDVDEDEVVTRDVDDNEVVTLHADEAITRDVDEVVPLVVDEEDEVMTRDVIEDEEVMARDVDEDEEVMTRDVDEVMTPDVVAKKSTLMSDVGCRRRRRSHDAGCRRRRRSHDVVCCRSHDTGCRRRRRSHDTGCEVMTRDVDGEVMTRYRIEEVIGMAKS